MKGDQTDDNLYSVYLSLCQSDIIRAILWGQKTDLEDLMILS